MGVSSTRVALDVVPESFLSYKVYFIFPLEIIAMQAIFELSLVLCLIAICCISSGHAALIYPTNSEYGVTCQLLARLAFCC